VLCSLKSQDIKEDDYEEILPDFQKDNLVIIEDCQDNIDILTEFSNNIENIKNIKENISKNQENQDIKKPKIDSNEEKKEINGTKEGENTFIRKHTETTDVFDEIQEEVDNFKITDFINEDCKFRVNVNESNSEEEKNDQSYDSTIENTDNKEKEDEENETENDEFTEEVKVVVNQTNEEKKQEETERLIECNEKIDFFKEKCISIVGEKRFNELYDHFYSLEDVL
jgi:hypothetical protein